MMKNKQTNKKCQGYLLPVFNVFTLHKYHFAKLHGDHTGSKEKNHKENYPRGTAVNMKLSLWF